MKYPDDCVICSDSSDPSNTYRDDRHVVNILRRDGDTTVIKIENFKENGELKYHRF